MTDREKHISVLQNIDRAYRTFTQEEYRALEYAIASLKTDEAYQLMYEGGEIFTKADMAAILTELQLEIEEKEQYYQDKFLESKNAVHEAAMGGRMFGCGECKELIQQKINSLNDGNIITNMEKFKEVFANLPVSLDTQKRLVIDDSNAPYGFWEQEYKKEEKK